MLNYAATFRRQGYGLKENDYGINFSRITIPSFHAGDLKEGNNYRTEFTNLT